jgi:hypothetical protein
MSLLIPVRPAAARCPAAPGRELDYLRSLPGGTLGSESQWPEATG